LSGFDREGWRVRETVHAQPARRWTLRWSVGVSRSKVPGGDNLLDRKSTELQTTWNPTNAIVLSGSWALWKEEERDNIRQSYNVLYAPGPKLSMSASYFEYETKNGMQRETSTSSASVSYQFNRHTSIFGSISESESRGGTDEGKNKSARAGLRFFF
jgi:hypothetical protein